MANRTTSRPAANESRLATNRAGAGTGILTVQSASGSVSVLALQDTAADTHYLWFDTTGDLRAGTTLPTAPNSDGVVVGGQS